MKVLWFTNTPSNASLEFGYKHVGGGWISSLETLLNLQQQVDLAICFFYSGDTYRKIIKGSTTYYGIPLNKTTILSRAISKHRIILNDSSETYIDEVLKDFNPDIIHVFGTENGFGEILKNKHEKVLFHLQGLTLPYSYQNFPPGFDKVRLASHSQLKDFISADSFIHKYKFLRKRGLREENIIKFWRYFSGRTAWDRNYVSVLNPYSQYFHCDEVLRDDFYNTEWTQPPHGNKLTICTTINPNIYKGLDVIYKTLGVLRNMDITWNLYGLTENHSLNKITKRILNVKNEPRLIFHGPQPSKVLIAGLEESNIFIHPSYIDNSPNSVCEAMLLGMPVIASAVGGIPSLIKQETDGMLFNPHDHFDLAGRIVELKKNPELARQIGKTARETALKRHDPEKIVLTLLDIYKNLQTL